MRSEVVAEVTKLRNQELEQAQQQLRQQLQQQVLTMSSCPTGTLQQLAFAMLYCRILCSASNRLQAGTEQACTVTKLLLQTVTSELAWSCMLAWQSIQVTEEQEQQLKQLRADMAERVFLNRERLEEEHASSLEAQAQVCNSLSVSHL